MRNLKQKWLVLAIFLISIPVFGLDQDEKTAISAIKDGDLVTLRAYIEKHPGANCEFSNGKTGLYYAIASDRFEICEYLLRNGADPDFMVDDNSVLKWAIRYNRERIARLLIEYGAEVNRTDKKLNTPLIYAAELNYPGMCKILVDRGADPLHENATGRRAGDFAYNYGASPAYSYLMLMEDLCTKLDTVPSMQDGPYIAWEDDDRFVVTYYERNQEINQTRMIEKTIRTGDADTIIQGFQWDHNSYHIARSYSPNPDSINTTGNIFVIGDIHGKYQALLFLLNGNGIIDKDLKWTFGDGHLVILGDVFDRGAYVTEVLWFLHELQIQARASGGNVHLLLGNHEIMALTRDDRYLNKKYEYFMRYTGNSYSRLFEKDAELGRWLRSQNVILRINGYLLTHAGISPEFADSGYAFSEVNERVRRYLDSDYSIAEGSPEDMILGSYGPQWYRGYYINNNNNNNYNNSDNFKKVTQLFVDDYLNSNGLKRMVIGHNEQQSITSAYGGKIILADVSLDESGRLAQGLLISGDKLFRCLSDGTREPLMDE